MIVDDIVNAIEGEITTLLPSYKKAAFVYDLARNNRKQSKKIYAIVPDSATSVTGTVQAITLDHNFNVTLSDIYKPSGDTDTDLQDKVLAIHTDIETLYKELFQRRLGLPSVRVLVVQIVDIAAPEVDQDNNFVSITATFNIKYRKESI